jgi:hypothetical protein
MSSLYLLLALVIAGALGAPPQAAADLEKDKAAIVEAALNYADGYYEGSGDRMARAVSPALTKRGLVSRPGVEPFLVQMNAEMLIDAARGGRGKLDPDKRNLAPKVLDIDGDIASAQVFTSGFNDYLHLVKRNGEWRLVNVLWHPPVRDASGPADADRAAVEQAVRTLTGALAAPDVSPLTKVLHPALAWRYFAAASDGSRIVVDQNLDTILAAVAGGQKLPTAGATIQVLGVDHDIASVKLTSPVMPFYLHLAKQKGAWRVVNVLGYPPARPASSR